MESTFRLHALLALLFLAVLSVGCTQPQEWQIQNSLGTRYGIFMMDASGTNVEQIYGSETKTTNALASPDGARIAFFEYAGQTGDLQNIGTSEIALINIDGTGYRKLTDNDWMDFQPIWSPDGNEILFISTGGVPAGTDIYVMDLDGNVLRQLTDTVGMSEADPDWKCGKVAFTRNGTVWIMDEDGSNEQQLTNPIGRGTDVGVQYPLGDYDPNLSPDCSKVAFERLAGTGMDVNGVNLGDYDLYVLELSTGMEHDISQNPTADLLPTWSPDGSKLLFLHLSNVAADLYDIYTINADGTGRTKVTGNDPDNFVEDSATWFGNRVIFTAEFYE